MIPTLINSSGDRITGKAMIFLVLTDENEAELVIRHPEAIGALDAMQRGCKEVRMIGVVSRVVDTRRQAKKKGDMMAYETPEWIKQAQREAVPEELRATLDYLYEREGRENPNTIGAIIRSKNDWAFEEWKRKVDAELLKKCGIDSDFLPDWDYRGAFDSKMAPAAAARRAIRNAKEY